MTHEMLDNSNQIYKDLYDTGKDRFTSLPYWHRSYSNWLKKENDNLIKNTYNSYKRGTIIYIDFGVNVGSEISGGHFAIVITKNDNRKSSMLNVVPLTSKNKKFYLPIDKTVFENASNVLKQHLEDYIKNIQRKNDTLDELTKEYDILYKETKKEIDFYRESDNVTIENYQEIDDKISKLQATIDTQKEIIKEIDKEKNMIEHVYRKYSNYDKQTFACYKSIQTVSKLKVRKINKFDPSGKMKVDNNTLDQLDKKILTEYTNIKLTD
ncbi:type II toxin-antitoxin system PemK/MazF family toxin [Macrococcus caseolyticus]|uniref:type II toxin-antitoxin system PemK/MazF family toxin n=1 Tax=Macrococcoides caseolyticum TaxID=69966 RepID=UPI002DBEC277|nr:type II toxin-antitoxin system PemK/MazF family toxin [Macrococcus caseolyticus]MEB8171693.1 type II toxin-antitoxin system PemK/MazF family toxin [Macrococcus caseolyticus]